ncbi:MAG TPA: lipopolysaccharide biosynthesis protein, partial [Burkholderiales bacterium]|nr:lipopolysaccharide biosynthesis protein [Burkholderiales bacterium]
MFQRVRQMFQRHRRTHWAVADQLLVSGSNFLTGIMLARLLGPAAFGVFVLLQAVLLYVNAFQTALIFSPMLSAAPQMEDRERARYLRGVLALQLALSAVMAAVVYALGSAGGLVSAAAALQQPTVLAVTGAVFAFQMQDWLRRYYFVHQNSRAAFLNDVVSYGGQIVMLVLFALFDDDLGLTEVFCIIGATSAVAFILGYAASRAPVRPAFGDARTVLRQGWRSGRDYFIGWQLQWAGTQGVLLVGAGLLGAQAAGGVRAAQNIIGPINILFQAMENVVPVAAARHYKEGGLDALSGYLWRNTAWGSALLLPVMLGLSWIAEPLVNLAYGRAYAGYAALVVWQAAAMFLQFYTRQLTYYLRTLQATGAIIQMGAVIAVTSVVVAACTVRS